MRPLAVLLVVIVAISTLIFALLFMGEGSGGSAPLNPTSNNTTTTSNSGSQPDANLAGGPRDTGTQNGDNGAERTVIKPTGDTTNFSNRLEGTVIDREGNKVAGAEVILDFQSSEILFEVAARNRKPGRKTTTNSNGQYAFENVMPSDFYTLYVSHSDFCPEKTTNVVVKLENISKEPPIVMKKGSALSGYVRDTGGAPVQGAELILDINMFSHSPGPERQVAISDEAGYYIIPHVPAGMKTLIAVADGFGTQAFGAITFNGRDPRTKDIELEVAALIAGKVTDAATGQPIENADVLALNYTNSSRSSRDFARTGKDGSFSLERLSPGDYTLMVNAFGYNNDRLLRVQTGELNVALELQRKAHVSGTVVGHDTGRALAAGELQLRAVHKGTELTSRVDVTGTFENGEFTLVDVPGGEYLIEASAIALGYAPTFSEPFTVTDGQDLSGVNIRVRRGGKIRGRIVDENGSPVAGALVSTHDNNYTSADDELTQIFGDSFQGNIVSQDVRTDGAGNFEIQALRADVYQINVRKQGFVRYIQRNIRLADGEHRDLNEVEMTRGGIVKGTLYDAGGQPLPGGQVHMRLQDENAFPERYQTKSDASGSYTIENIRPGTYSISATSSATGGSNPFQDIADRKATESKIAVNEGRTLNHDLHLTGQSGLGAPVTNDPRRR